MSVLDYTLDQQEAQMAASRPSAPLPTSAEQEMSSETLEQAVISIIAEDPQLSVIVGLEDTDFGIPAYRATYNAITTLSNKGASVDEVSIWEELNTQRMTQFVESYENLRSIITQQSYTRDAMGKINTYVGLLRDRSNHKQLNRIAKDLNKAVSEGYSSGLSPSEVRARFSQADAEAHGLLKEETGRTMESVSADFLNDVEFGSDITRIPTGVRDIDRALNGGFDPQSLITIAGHSGMGKSVLAAQIALNAAMVRKERVKYYSLEMAMKVIIQRVNAAMCQISLSVLKSNRADPNNEQRLIEPFEIDLLKRNLDRLNSGRFDISDNSKRTSTANIRADLARAKVEGDPYRVIVVDTLYDLEPDRRIDDERLRINAVVDDLKNIADEYQLTVILVAQANRSAEEQPVYQATMNMLRGSGAIENKSDSVIFVGMTDLSKYADSGAEQYKNMFRSVKIAKDRNAERGRVIDIEFEGMFQRFCSIGAVPHERLAGVGSPFNVGEASDRDLPDNYHELSRIYTKLGVGSDGAKYVPKTGDWGEDEEDEVPAPSAPPVQSQWNTPPQTSTVQGEKPPAW